MRKKMIRTKSSPHLRLVPPRNLAVANDNVGPVDNIARLLRKRMTTFWSATASSMGNITARVGESRAHRMSRLPRILSYFLNARAAGAEPLRTFPAQPDVTLEPLSAITVPKPTETVIARR
jgi:hypothetical protein